LQIFYDPTSVGLTYQEIANATAVLPVPIKLGGSRLVVHIQTAPEAIDEFLDVVRTLAEEKKKSGFIQPGKTAVNSNGSIYQDVHVRIRDGVSAE
jgi:threonine aldolase